MGSEVVLEEWGCAL